MLSEISHSQKGNYCMIPLIWIKFIKTENGMVVNRDWEKGEWGVDIQWVSVLQNEEVLEMDDGDGCTTI